VDRSEIQDKVCSILAEQLAVDAGKVTPEARFSEDLDADSLDLVEAVLALEEEFGVSIPEEEMENVATVGQAIDLIAEKLGASA
jgi:acyl carrier protein